MPRPFVFRGARLVLLALAAALVAPAPAAPDEKQAATPKTEERTTHVDFGGMKIAIDPATGRLRPLSAEEAQRLGAAMRQKLAELRARAAARHAGEPAEPASRASAASRSAVVGLSHLKYSAVSIAPDGSLEFRCLTSSDAPPSPAAASKDRE